MAQQQQHRLPRASMKPRSTSIDWIYVKGKRGLSKRHIVDLTSGDYNYGHFIAKGKHVVAQRQDMNHANGAVPVQQQGRPAMFKH